MRVSPFVFAVSVLLITSGSGRSQSFDCRAALTAAEDAICADEELRDLDNRMAQLYLSIINDPTHAYDAQLRRGQAEWLKQRDDCRDSADCLKQLYRKRIQELRESAKTQVPAAVLGRWSTDENSCADNPAEGVTVFQFSPREVRAMGAVPFDCKVRKARPTVEGTFIKVHCARGGGGYFDIRGVGADFLLLYAPSEDGSGEDEFALKRCPKEAAGGPASAAAPTYWKLDRSIVYLQADGSSRKFFYESPGPALQRLGVRRGALVFAGEAVDHVIEGEAYVYTHRCGPLGYVVSGPLKEGADRLTLRGGAPTVDKDCHAKGRRRSVLEFRLIGQRPSPKETQR